MSQQKVLNKPHGLKGKPRSQETKAKISQALKGKKKKYESYLKGRTRLNHPAYKQGKQNREETTTQRDLLYFWKQAVLKNGNYCCFITKKSSTKADPLVCHHLEGWSANAKSRFAVTNGICLLRSIHKRFHSICGWKNATLEFFENFCKNEYQITVFPWVYGNHEPSVTLNDMKDNHNVLINIYKAKLETIVKERGHSIISCDYQTVRSKLIICCSLHDTLNETIVVNYKKSVYGCRCCSSAKQSFTTAVANRLRNHNRI